MLRKSVGALLEDKIVALSVWDQEGGEGLWDTAVEILQYFDAVRCELDEDDSLVQELLRDLDNWQKQPAAQS
jgi:hypothetical protein